MDSYYPTIENVFEKTVKHRGQDFQCDIVDTAGQDEYSILNSKHAIGIHGYVLVYSIASRTSFEMIQTVYDKILNYTGTSTVPCVLVGQKSDLHSQRYVFYAHERCDWEWVFGCTRGADLYKAICSLRTVPCRFFLLLLLLLLPLSLSLALFALDTIVSANH